MSPFKALYGRSCRTPLSWSESGERTIFGLNIVIETEEKEKQICANILTTQSHQKSYTDKQCHPLDFEVGDHVYVRVRQLKLYVGLASRES
jgi:co-chaperonin GroES (HSP10)